MSEPTLVDQALRWLRDATESDWTLHSINGYDGDNNYCFHPNSDPDIEYRGETLEQCVATAILGVEDATGEKFPVSLAGLHG